jgi:hypothetical protein
VTRRAPTPATQAPTPRQRLAAALRVPESRLPRHWLPKIDAAPLRIECARCASDLATAADPAALAHLASTRPLHYRAECDVPPPDRRRAFPRPASLDAPQPAYPPDELAARRARLAPGATP